MNDDSFYYLSIARNIANGYGITFDKIHLTNGFQPLFQFILVPIFWLTDDSITAVYLMKILESIFFGISCLLFLYLIKLIFKPTISFSLIALSIFILPVWGIGILFLSIIGMESSLNILLLLLLMIFFYKVKNYYFKFNKSFFIFYGFLISMTFFARLDNFIVIFVIALDHCITCLKENHKKILFKNLIFSAFTSIIIVSPYIIWNLYEFNNLIPISERTKLLWAGEYKNLLNNGFSYWSNIFWFLSTNLRTKYLIIFSYLAFFLLIFVKLFKYHLPIEERSRKCLDLLFPLYTASVVKISYYLLTFRENPSTSLTVWYYALDSLLLTIFIVLTFHIFILFFKRRLIFFTNLILKHELIGKLFLVIMFLIIIFLGLFKILSETTDYNLRLSSYEHSIWINQNIPADSLIGCFDSGIVGYFSDRKVINLDGLVNNVELYEYRKKNNMKEYIYKKQIKYLTNILKNEPNDTVINIMGKESVQLIHENNKKISDIDEGFIKIYKVLY